MTVTSLANLAHAQTDVLVAAKEGNQEITKEVTVALSYSRGGTSFTRENVLCGTISRLDSSEGWVKISAKASDKAYPLRNVSGWLHKVYDTKLMGECARERAHRGIQVAEAVIHTDHLAKFRVKETVAQKEIKRITKVKAASGSAAKTFVKETKTAKKDEKIPDTISAASLLPDLLRSHGLIKAAQSDLNAANERKREAWGAWFPNLVVGSHWALEDNNKAPGSDDTRMYARGLDLTATQLLWDFGGANAGIRIAELGQDIAAVNLEVTKQDLLLRAITAYLNFKRAGDVLKYAVQSERNIKKQTELENALVRRGAGLSSDVMQAKQQLAAASALRVQSLGALKVAQNNYRAVFRTDPPPFSKMGKTKIPISSLPKNLKDAVEIAGRENPKLKVASTSTVLTREAVKVATGALSPRIEAIATAKHKDNQGGTAGIAEEYSGKFQVTWPINLGLTAINTLSAAKSDSTATDLRVGEQRYLIEEQVRNAWDSLQTARSTSQFLRNQANIASEFLEVARKERKMGNRSLLDVLAGETALINAISAARSAETDIRLFAFTLLNAMGRLTLDTIKD